MTHAVSPSELSKLPTNKTKTPLPFACPLLWLSAFRADRPCAAFTWLSRDESLDRWITGFWYDAATHHFPLQQNPLLDLLNHRLAKYVAIALAVIALFTGLTRRNARLVTAALLMGLGGAW